MSDLRISISRKTALKVAEGRLKETGLSQVVYIKKDDRYATMNKRAWWMMKPGKLVCIMQRPDPNLRSIRNHEL